MAVRSKAAKASSSSAGGEGSASNANGGGGAVARSSTRRARTNASTTTGSAVSAQTSARVGLLSGLIEGTLAIMELFAGLSITRLVCLGVYRQVNSLQPDEHPPPWNMFCIQTTCNLLVMAWLVWRMSQKSQPVCTLGSMAARLHLWPLPTRISKDTLNTLLLVFCLHFFGTAGMFAVQWASDKWIFGWANYWTSEKGWDHANIADMLLFAPLREELTFRGIMFSIFYLRGAAFKLATPTPAPAITAEGDAAAGSSSAAAPAPAASPESLAWTSSWKRDCVLASTVTFGLVHALNILGSRYTRTYVMLQIVLACLIGAFYCMRFVRSEHTMFEAVWLHVINNLFSSALPVEANLDLSSPLVTLPLLLTFAVYGTLTYREYKLLMASPPSPFQVLLPQNVSPQTAVAAVSPAAPASAAETKEE